jgi:hypothetical protein
LVHPFQQVFKTVEAILPDAGHLARPVDQRSQGAKLCAVVRLATYVAVAHQPGLLQNPQMLRDGGLRDPGPGRQSSDGLLAFAAQSLEQRPPGWIGEGSKEFIVSLGQLGPITC